MLLLLPEISVVHLYMTLLHKSQVKALTALYSSSPNEFLDDPLGKLGEHKYPTTAI
jgi:hypothetical protein